MREEHHPTLAPSSLPAKRLCIWFEPQPFVRNAAAIRGDLIHKYTARLLKEGGVGSFPIEDATCVARADWAAKAIRERIKSIVGIEERVSLTDNQGEEITHGRLDIWGWNDGDDQLVVGDIKSGREKDYAAQLAVYALAKMDEVHQEECRILMIYCDSEVIVDYSLSSRDAEDLVFGIVRRINEGTEPPQENDYCNYCARRPTCPVWVNPATSALQTVGIDPIVALNTMLDDPDKLGNFLVQWKKAKKLVDEVFDIEGRIKTLLSSGIPVEGWRLLDTAGNESFTADQVAKLLLHLREMGTQRASKFVKIDPKKFAIEWKEYSSEPQPEIPERADGYQKLWRDK